MDKIGDEVTTTKELKRDDYVVTPITIKTEAAWFMLFKLHLLSSSIQLKPYSKYSYLFIGERNFEVGTIITG